MTPEDLAIVTELIEESIEESLPNDNILTGRVGKIAYADGVRGHVRLMRDASIATANSKPLFYDQVRSRNIFSLTLPAITTGVAAGNIISAAADAATQFALWNPKNSTKNLALLKFGMWIVSGTTPVTGFFHSFSSKAPTILSSVANPITCNYVGYSSPSCVAGALSSAAGSNLTGSSALQIIRAADFAVAAGTFSNLAVRHAIEFIDGDIVIPPDTCWVPTWSASGSSLLCGYSITWQEIDR